MKTTPLRRNRITPRQKPAAAPPSRGRRAPNRAQTPANALIQRGSGNVFIDVGFPPEEAENLLIRADLMLDIERRIEKMTQAKAAVLLGVSQPRVSDLVRGKIEMFTIDSLVNMLAHAGAKVRVSVK